ncbi:hypothetical protein [Leptospira noguchii]|uniref:hypothetical protein n=1 Tax=Leptospira noguchii TaxID=28182 RepID=UPI000773C942|nr:hypothetical protein [Leptospira noguchii]
MYVYKVGGQYSNRTKWEEGGHYFYRQGQHELLLFYKDPTEREINAVRKGEAKFAFLEFKSIILFSYSFDPAIPLSDSAYSIHRLSDSEKVLPPKRQKGESTLLHVILVDADTGIIKALRQRSFSEEFANRLEDAIIRQYDNGFNQTWYDQNLKELFAKYTTVDLALAASVRE